MKLYSQLHLSYLASYMSLYASICFCLGYILSHVYFILIWLFISVNWILKHLKAWKLNYCIITAQIPWYIPKYPETQRSCPDVWHTTSLWLNTQTVFAEVSVIQQFVTPTKKYSPNDPRQRQINDAIVTLIVGDLLPLSLVESDNFRHGCDGMSWSQNHCPSRKHFISTMLHNKTNSTTEALRLELQQTQAVCLTIDWWYGPASRWEDS